jgi:hypothetical protein
VYILTDEIDIDEVMRELAEEYDAKMPLRAQLLREAEEITCGDRHMDYGDPVTNHERIAAIASAATGHQLSAHDVVMVLIAAKMARARISPTKRDHYVDMMAYAGIAYECAMDEAERQDDDGLDGYDV